MGKRVTGQGCVCRWIAVALLVALAGTGCQVSSPPAAKLVECAEKVNDTGLAPAFTVQELEASASLPMGWRALPAKPQKTLLYSHQQWRSPTKRTAVGITYARMPLPLSTKMLVWFAMNEVSKKSNDGRIIRQWSDEAGRQWFEAENSKYHMTGYVMSRGFDAWINYAGYRVNEPKIDEEVELATKALETILPMSVAETKVAKAAETPSTASAE